LLSGVAVTAVAGMADASVGAARCVMRPEPTENPSRLPAAAFAVYTNDRLDGVIPDPVPVPVLVPVPVPVVPVPVPEVVPVPVPVPVPVVPVPVPVVPVPVPVPVVPVPVPVPVVPVPVPVVVVVVPQLLFTLQGGTKNPRQPVVTGTAATRSTAIARGTLPVSLVIRNMDLDFSSWP
jgi:hypothetical protein